MAHEIQKTSQEVFRIEKVLRKIMVRRRFLLHERDILIGFHSWIPMKNIETL